MNWKTSRSIRLAVDILTVIAFLGLFFPWLYLGEEQTEHTLGFSLFWRIGFLVIWGRYFTRFWRFSNIFQNEKTKKVTGIAFIMVSIFLLLFLVYYPGLGGQPEDKFFWFFSSLILLLWGIYSGTDEVSARVLHRVLIGGSFSYALFFLAIFRMDLWEQLQGQALLLTIGWFLLIIVTLGLNRVLEYSRYSAEREDRFTRFWSPLFGALAVVCIFLAGLISFVLPGVVNILRTPFRAVLTLVQLLLNAVFWVFAFIAAGIIRLLNRFLEPVGWTIDLEEHEGPILFQEGEQEFIPQSEPISETIIEIGTVLVSIIVFAMVAYIIFALIKHKKEEVEDFTETRESIASADMLTRWAGETLLGIKKAWAEGLGKLKRPRDYSTATEIYNAVLQEMARWGNKKPPGMTPHRFQKRIKLLLPEGETPADRILNAFSSEYYGGQTLPPGHLETLREDLQEVLRSIKAMKKEKAR